MDDPYASREGGREEMVARPDRPWGGRAPRPGFLAAREVVPLGPAG